ncbi:unnamed protein product [Hermetia illucens]|uniref:Uncharacterized protein n=2 Tax=Hermetia illucens TaxID=343691 RepID=A0A7R8V648_HERIL|nr:unnamed protein product [Hermetia illucens]
MSDDICEVSRIVKKAENEAHLRRTQSEALNRIYKLELVLKILKTLDVNQLDVPDKQRLRNSLKVLGIQDCISLPNSDKLLGLDNAETISLSYTDRKALRETLFNSIRNVCTPIVENADRMQKDIPEIFDTEAKHSDIIALEEKRRKLQQELLNAKSRKCELLKKCTELKLASYEKNAVNILVSEYKLNDVKAETLQGYLVQEFCSRTQHTVKAVKEVERFIDAELEEDG